MQTFLVISLIGLLFCMLTTLAVTDVILKDFGSLKRKVIWGAIAMVPFIGWAVYLVLGFRTGKRIKKNDVL